MRALFRCTFKKENTEQPSTSTTAAQTVAIATHTIAIAAPEKAAAIATTVG